MVALKGVSLIVFFIFDMETIHRLLTAHSLQVRRKRKDCAHTVLHLAVLEELEELVERFLAGFAGDVAHGEVDMMSVLDMRGPHVGNSR